MSSTLIGQTLGNKYEILELIGKGGMATVYKGYQSDIDRYVAIKVLPPHPDRGDEFMERFHLEARTIARLQHPHILPVYDYGTQDSIVYLAVAYVDGGSLGGRIGQGPLPLDQIEKYLREISSALDYAHRQNIVHRDIKPDNILINSEGYTLLADFGIAKILEGDAGLTVTGGLVGTPAYMAPELAHSGDVTAAADIYSLGVVTFEMLTGKQPYSADTPFQIVMKHVTEPVPRVSSIVPVPLGVEQVMVRVLAKDPGDRYATASEFAQAFSRAVQDHAGHSTLNTIPETLILDGAGGPEETATLERTAVSSSQPVPPNNTLLILGGLTILALLVVAIVALIVFSMNENNERDDVPATAASTSVAAAQPRSFGRATYTTVNTPGDTLSLRAEDFPASGSGTSYVVWLVNTDTEAVQNAGRMNIDALGSGVFTYTDAEGRFLPGAFNSVMISREEDATVEQPSGEIVFVGSYPAAFAGSLTAILVEADGGIDGQSLAASALAEAELGERHGNLAATSGNMGGVLTHTEHTINILNGTEEDYNGNGRGENPSSAGLGVPHFLDLIESELDAGLSDSTSIRLQSEAELIRVCLENARFTMGEIVALEQTILEADSPEAIEDELNETVRLLHVLVNGDDLNGNGQVEPFEGECSLAQIETYGVLAGTMDIVEG